VQKNKVLYGIKEDKHVQYTVKRRKAIWIGHFLLRNCLLKPIIEGKIKGTARGRRRRRCKGLLDDV
jgi:hypothetical protein